MSNTARRIDNLFQRIEDGIEFNRAILDGGFDDGRRVNRAPARKRVKKGLKLLEDANKALVARA